MSLKNRIIQIANDTAQEVTNQFNFVRLQQSLTGCGGLAQIISIKNVILDPVSQEQTTNYVVQFADGTQQTIPAVSGLSLGPGSIALVSGGVIIR